MNGDESATEARQAEARPKAQAEARPKAQAEAEATAQTEVKTVIKALRSYLENKWSFASLMWFGFAITKIQDKDALGILVQNENLAIFDERRITKDIDSFLKKQYPYIEYKLTRIGSITF